MPRVNLTDKAIPSLKAPLTGQTDYFDGKSDGLVLRVSHKGRRTFAVMGRVDGKLKRVTLGPYGKSEQAGELTLAAARAAAIEIRQAMRAGVDVTAEKKAERAAEAEKASRFAFERVFETWMRRDQGQNRSAAEVRRMIERDVLSSWRGKPVHEIDRADVLEILDGVADRAPVVARRLFAHLHRFFRWNVGRGTLPANPMEAMEKPGGKEVSRDRVLTDGELAEVWQAADALGWPFGCAIQLLILTAARREEIGAATWDEIDREGAAIRLEGRRTKNGTARMIPLSAPAMQIVEKLPVVANKARYVFTTGSGDEARPVSGWSKAKAIIDRKILSARREAIAKAGGDPKTAEPMQPWRIHDLRRTAATGLQRLGARLEVTEALLGHISGSRSGVVGVYQRHSFADEARAAAEAWGAKVMEIVGQEPAKVIELRRVRRR